MINLVVALQCEAKPFIHHYRMKGNANHSPFRIYEGDDIRLIVCGIGKVSAAAATSYLHSVHAYERNCAWLNIGIAGHADKHIGEGFLIHKITDAGSGTSWYPPIVISTPCMTDSLVTVDRAEYNFSTADIYDMEASGFYATASRFTTAEIIHSYKVISDNRSQPAKIASEHIVEQLIGEHIYTVNEITTQMNRLSSRLYNIESVPEDMDRFLDSWRFTSHEQNRLRHLLKRLTVLSPDENIWNDTLARSRTGKEVLTYLQQRIDSLPVSYSATK